MSTRAGPGLYTPICAELVTLMMQDINIIMSCIIRVTNASVPVPI